jgi:hypothetical protein
MFSIIIAFAIFSTMYTRMKNRWFKTNFWIAAFVALLALALGAPLKTGVLAQEPTPGSSDVFITVTYSEQINIRNGPGTVLYDIIGNMQPGESAQALGVSPGRDWVQIVFPAGPGGVGWVHTSLISLSSGNLQIIEPPPTVTPLVTSTIDPTLAAAYVFEPTVTRMPTFTPPPPLEIPQFTALPSEGAKNSVPMGALVIGSGIISAFSFLISMLRRR